MKGGAATRLHWPCLMAGVALMLVGTAYPLIFARADGRADHGVAMLVFWAMSAGFVRGVGFVPVNRVARWIFSGWSCFGAIGLAIVLAAVGHH